MRNFSSAWRSSKNPGKQRKFVYKGALHVKQKMVNANLSKELRTKHGFRSLGIRKGDKVKVVRGQFRKHLGKVDRVDLKKTKIYVEGVELIKKDGTKTAYPIHPSNIMLIELNLDDKKRQKILERKKKAK